MSQNVELIKKFYTSFKNQDKLTYLQLCDDNIEWTVMENVPNGGTHIGKKAVFENYFPNLFAQFQEFHALTEEFLDAGDKVIVLGKYKGITKKTKRSFESPFAHIYTIKDEKILKFRQYTDTVKIQDVLKSS
jgi:ketosteroid isomerase-like protein